MIWKWGNFDQKVLREFLLSDVFPKFKTSSQLSSTCKRWRSHLALCFIWLIGELFNKLTFECLSIYSRSIVKFKGKKFFTFNKKWIKKRCLILAGLEPAIPWFVVRCLIHWATRPVLLHFASTANFRAIKPPLSPVPAQSPTNNDDFRAQPRQGRHSGQSLKLFRMLDFPRS